MHDPDPFPVKDAANETLEPAAVDAEAATGTDAEQELQRAVARADQYQDQFLRAKAEAENIKELTQAFLLLFEGYMRGKPRDIRIAVLSQAAQEILRGEAND